MGTYVPLDKFVPEILQYANGCPTIMARTHIRNTIINFCERTLMLKREPSSFCIDEDEHTYLLKFDSDRYVALAIDEGQEGEGNTGRILDETTEHWLDNSLRNWRTQTGNKVKRYFLTNETNKVRFQPTPTEDSDDDIFMMCRVKPARDATEVDEFLWEQWEDVIQAGALATLLMIPGATWFNSELANSMTDSYRRGIRRARKTVLGGNSQSPTAATPQSYDVVGSQHYDGRSNRWV